MKIGEGMVSEVHFHNGIISKKYFTPFEKYADRSIQDHWDRELKALHLLSGRKHFPKLISVIMDAKIINMSYCGEPLTAINLSKDWKKQCKQIQRVCRQVRVFHQDFVGSNANPIPPHIKNVLVLNGVIHIIDFGIWSDGKSPFKDTITQIIRKVYKNGRRNNRGSTD